MADTDIRALVESRATDIEGLLAGSGLTVDRFKATVFQLWEKDPELRKCTPDSILSGILQVADLGLTLSPALGHAYLVKYGSTATPQTGYKGLMHLALQSGGALDFRPGVRRQADHWRYRPLHPTEPIEHEPADGNRGPIVGYYAVVFLPGGLARSAYMTKAEVEAHRDKYSKAYKATGKWGFGSFDDMTLKTVVRQACKFLRLTGQLEKAVRMADAIDPSLGNEDELPPDDLPTPHVEVMKDDKPSAPALKLTADKPVVAGNSKPSITHPAPPATIKGTAIEDELIAKWRSGGRKLSEFQPWLKVNFNIDDIGDLLVDKVTFCSEAMDADG